MDVVLITENQAGGQEDTRQEDTRHPLLFPRSVSLGGGDRAKQQEDARYRRYAIAKGASLR